MSKYTDFIGSNISVGTGIKTFFKIHGEYLNTADDVLKANGVVIEVGVINDVTFSTNRDISPSYIAGNKNPQGMSKGKRLVSGRISFAVLGREFLDYVLNVLLEDPILKDKLNPGKNFDVDANRFGIRQEATEDNDPTLYFKDKNLQYLDQLPPVDIIVIGRGDHIHSMTGGILPERKIFDIDDEFQMGSYYRMSLENCKFLNDSFGFSAGAPVQDQTLDFICLGDKESWHLVNHG